MNKRLGLSGLLLRLPRMPAPVVFSAFGHGSGISLSSLPRQFRHLDDSVLCSLPKGFSLRCRLVDDQGTDIENTTNNTYSIAGRPT